MTPRALNLAVAALVIAVVMSPSDSSPAWAQAGDPAKSTEEITVLGTQDKIINDFVYSTAAPTNTLVGQLARWEKGMCPATTGLSPGFNKFVTARVKEVAAQVGAKVDSKSPCKTNVQIFFTADPQGFLDGIRRKTPALLGSHYKAEEKDLATVRQPIQAWYATATADDRGKLTLDDIGDISQACEFVINRQSILGTIYTSECNDVRGSRVNEGWRSEFANVTVVVDINKISDIEIGPVADDIAMLALAQTKISDTCRSIPSISNLFAPDCDGGRKTKALTAYDMAYLAGLYQMNTGLTAPLQKINLADWMKIKLQHP